ncbi:ABC transporter ATP-binding protein [Rickettsiales bacterium LUAb2]
MTIQINNLSYTYGTSNLLNEINLAISDKQFISIIGKSGSGKTTLLQILAGIIKDFKGDVLINQQNIKKKAVITAYMPQKDLLIPFKTIFNNLTIPLLLQKKSKTLIKSVINQYLQEFDLEMHANKYPSELSGGEKQRIALLRTILVNSKILLLDEPFAQLDYINKIAMQSFLYKLHVKNNYTTILVTHDIEEAIFLSDIVYVLGQNGNIEHKLNIKFDQTNNKKNIRSSELFFNYKNQLLNYLNII